MDSRIITPKVERVLLYQGHKVREYVTGTLCLTDRHLIFIEPTGLQETWILYHHIQSVDRQPLTTRGYPLVIDTRTFRQLILVIPRESECLGIIETINSFAQPDKYSELYAFQYKPTSGSLDQSSGWNIYEPLVEYGRMGLPNEHWRHTSLNNNYELCETYSQTIFVPTAVEKSVIIGSAKFRSKGRLPALSYYYDPKKTALCRSSQPLSYITRRSQEDEAMIQSIIGANPNSSFLYLLDSRPKINAMANKAAHKGGYENTDHYSNIHYLFNNIQNIHVMRESLQKLLEAVHSSNGVSSVLQALDASSWLKHVHLIMETSNFIARALCIEGVNVLVHCSDGWDRTAQTCSLASLLIDPYYRTIHGFTVLIEKEWLSFGHKFSIRSGHLNGDSKETSPIFTQFLDTVWQVLIQFPTHFQFNELFLITIHDHLFSSQFGTFLGNNEKERKVHKFNKYTYSLWGYIWTHIDDFTNPLYKRFESEEMLVPKTDVALLSFWRGLYCRYEVGPHPQELPDEVAGSLKQQNICLKDHIKYLEQHKLELETQLKEYRETLSCDGHVTDSVHVSFAHTNDTSTAHTNDTSTTHANDTSTAHTNDTSTTHTNDTSTAHANDVSTAHANDTSTTHTSQSHEDPFTNCDDVQSSAKGQTTKGRHESFQLRPLLLHIPEVNLPWSPLRGVAQCGCGAAFTFSKRKYNCSYCGTVNCNTCSEYHTPLPYLATPSLQHRVCKMCSKIMASKINEDQSN